MTSCVNSNFISEIQKQELLDVKTQLADAHLREVRHWKILKITAGVASGVFALASAASIVALGILVSPIFEGLAVLLSVGVVGLAMAGAHVAPVTLPAGPSTFSLASCAIGTGAFAAVSIACAYGFNFARAKMYHAQQAEAVKAQITRL